MNATKRLIYDLSYPELEAAINALGESGYRAGQIWHAIYQRFRTSFNEISTLSKILQDKLSTIFSFQALIPIREIQSSDSQTVKTLFRLVDNPLIEAVLMHYDERHTLCISTQSGCAIGCSFCATGQMGFNRNLTSGEIIAQVLYYARMLWESGERVTNVVLMGMGEPFLNFDSVMGALDRLNAPEGFGLGARRFTISTVGVIPGIIRFANEDTQYNLAISLHTVDDALRSELIPINKMYPVDKLIEACRYYIKRTNRRITFEYALIQGVNDSLEDANALVNKIKGMICHVNLIPLNPTSRYAGQSTPVNQVNAFATELTRHNIPCTIRLRRGIEIQAGCGQLAAENS